MTSPHRTCGKLNHLMGCECDLYELGVTTQEAKAMEIWDKLCWGLEEWTDIDGAKDWSARFIKNKLINDISAALEAEYVRGVTDCQKNIDALCEAARKAGREEAHLEIARKQLEIYGESVTLNGRVVTNEELYKQPTDYVKEADAEGYRRGLEKAAEIAEKTKCEATYPNSDECECFKEIAEEIRQQ